MKHKFYTLSIVFFFSIKLLQAQAPSIQWQNVAGIGATNDEPYCIQQTADSGYVVAGRLTNTSGSSQYPTIVKYSKTGSVQWTKQFATKYSNIKCIKQTPDGGYVTAGITDNTLVSGYNGNYDGWVMKLTDSGTISWQKAYGTVNRDNFESIALTKTGGYVMLGLTEKPTQVSSDIWATEISSTGAVIWNKTYGTFTFDDGTNIQQTFDGGFVFAGTVFATSADVSYYRNSYDIWVVKTNSLGVIQWEKTYGGTGADKGTYILQTKDSGYIVSGFTSSLDDQVTNFKGGFWDGWVFKINSTGTLQWQKTLGGTKIDVAQSVQQTKDGGYIVAGYTESVDGDVVAVANRTNENFWVTKLSSTGSLQWQKLLGGTGTELPNSIQQTNDGGYAVTGYTTSMDGDVIGKTNSNNSWWVVKFSAEVKTPTIKSFSPTKAATGATVTIKGTNFTGATVVSFGGTNAASFSVTNDSTIAAIVGSGANGSVSVTTPNGTASLAGFTYCAITAINQNINIEGCNSAVYNSTTYTASTTKKDTLKTLSGCDSVYRNINITVNLPTTSTTSKIANITYTWNGTTYTTSGTYSKTFAGGNSQGCDSTATLNLTIISAGCWYKISAGVTHVIAIKGDGTLWAWGAGTYGQLGNGSTTDKKIPTQIGTASNWESISAGNNYSMAIKTDGTLWAWGYNADGQLGDGTITIKTQPTQIGTTTNWASVATGEGHTVAIKTDSTLWAWGSNVYGQLGDGTLVNKTTPIQISNANNWASVTTKSVTTYAIKTNGSLWAWGRNNYGQMGDLSTLDKYSPTQIGTDNSWSKVSAGYSHVIGLKNNGTLWVWGLNNFKQLGDGTTIDKTAPIKIGTQSNWANIATGFHHSIAVKSDGTLWTWGYNFSGQLGNATTTNGATPLKIGIATIWGNISAGNSYTSATQTDGSIWSWGSNLYYQLGDGTSTDKLIPTLTSSCNNCIGLIPINTTVNLSGCSKVVYNGITYTSNTIKLDTIKTLQGCDSVYKTANITITNTPPSIDTFATVCNSINWYGTVFTKDTVATYTKTNNITSTLSEGFNLGTTAPTGWIFAQISGTYTTAGNYGAASPSLKFGAGNDLIITPALAKPATQLSFWLKSQGATPGCSLYIDGFNGTSWINVNIITTFPTTGTTIIYNATSTPALPASLTKFRFTYNKTVGNISFDDLSINYNGGSNGCDSVIRLNLTVSKPTTTNINLRGCVVVYKGITYTNSAIVRDTLKTNLGCDSVYKIANISINPITTKDTTLYLTGCNSVTYEGNVYSNSTAFLDTIRSTGNCDSIYLAINIFVNHNFTGNIKHPTKGNINNVTVKLNGNNANTIVSSGNYAFNCLPNLAYGSVKLSKNNDVVKNNGVSAFDVILTQNHILGKTKFNSPYKIIAADVNNNKTVTNIDLIFMKRLILGLDTTFTGNRLWAFVDSAYIFPDTTNPFPYKDSISFTNLTSNKTNQTFIGVKLGDVNYDWNATVARGVASKPVELVYEVSNSYRVQNPIRVKVTANNFKELIAMQYTLNFNHDLYDLIDITDNKLGIEFNATQANKTGNISFLWTDKNAEEKTLEDGTEIFTLVLRSKWQVVSSEWANNLQFTINNSITEIEALDKDYQLHQITLSKSQTPTSHLPLATSEIWTVSPNPTNGDVVVSLTSNSNKTVVFELSNAQGKKLYTQSFEAVKGNNILKLNLKKKTDLPSGLYFLKAIGLDNNTVNKVIIR